MKILVGIASYGEKNLPFLRRIISQYQKMRFSVDIVVFSEAAKDLGTSVSVVIGLPAENPWSLPFAHRAYFVENLDQYDLFIYSEDDMEVSESNLDAFLELQSALPDDEIAGFVRFELSKDGEVCLPDFRDHYHWKVDSVRRRGVWTVAEFGNAHSAMYVLSQSQLKRAVQSSGFGLVPHEGEYDMLCSAATDPYTSCGMTRVIAISNIANFLVRHVPNRYAGKVGLPLKHAEAQIRAMLEMASGSRTAHQLLGQRSIGDMTKSYYEALSTETLALLSQLQPVRNLLSVGCGSGDTESELVKSGLAVTALPLDSVIGAVAEARGIETICGSLDESLSNLEGRRFDAIFVSNLLHLLEDPVAFVRRSASLLSHGGSVIVASRNESYLPRLWRSGRASDGQISNLPTVKFLGRLARECGLRLCAVHWHGYNDQTALSGAMHTPGGAQALARGAWKWTRQGGRMCDRWLAHMRSPTLSSCSPSRWLATDFAVHLIREP